MSPIGPESFQRLEDFPSFISCIKCFGKPIIPPLLTPNRRYELKQLRIAAAAKEIEFQRRRKKLANQLTQDDHLLSYQNSNEFYESGLLSNVQESCALWYPSFKNNQERISVAISKFPTNDIYSSVHSSAIVCSNVIENSHAFSSRMGRDSVVGSQTSGLGCTECSHNSMHLECSLCQVECNRGCRVRNSAPEISPEVPCRTFSLLQQSVGVLNDELNSTVEDTEGESLPTIIQNPKYHSPDTDSESNITSMTQSTDLEKYMQRSCEFSSPDCSAIVWDSRSASLPYVLSRSDDASSETIVNTENELTPCASTLAELTDNIEDEMSNAEENVALTSNKDTAPSRLKRAHSVDSYMKIIQSCARNLNVKKSLSEPFNTTVDTSPKKENGARITLSSKASLLIKEDSKESEESKDIPEKDVSVTENDVETSQEYDRNIATENGDSFEKKHVRQNSYTLERPSSALILAHADCACNLDSGCVSPHCSALKGGVDITHPSAFTKEKVGVNDDLLRQQMKKLPMFGPEDSSCSVTSVEHSTSAVVIDVFPVTEESSSEKYDSRNVNVSGEKLESEKEISDKTSCNADEKEEALCEKFSDDLNISEEKKNPENVKNILDKFKENEIQMERLIKEQKELWVKLQREYEERNKIPHDQLNTTSASSNDTNSFIEVDEKCEMKSFEDDCCKETSSISEMPDKENISDGNSILLSPTCTPVCTPFSFIQASTSPNLCEVVYPSKDLNLPSIVRASASPSPSIEIQTSHPSPSKPVDIIEDSHSYKDCQISVGCQNANDSVHSNVSEALPSVNGYACSFPARNYLPRTSNSGVLSSNENCDTCFCDKSPAPCECCASYNGFCSFHISDPVPSYLPRDPVCDLGIKHVNNQVDLLHYSQSSSSLGFPSQRMNPGDFSAAKSYNPGTADLPNRASDSGFVPQTVSLKNLEMPSAATSSKERKYLSSPTSRESGKLYEDTSPPKTLKNGSISHQEKSLNRRLIDEPVLMKKFEKLPAFVKGYLTRRLFKTERVQSLIKTLQDTALLIGKLSEDLSRKGDSVSERDVDFHRQLIVQLMTTFHNVYDIFCTVSTKERMSIITESRNQRHPKMKPESESSVSTEVPDPAFSKKHKLSSATLKALERKRRTPIDSRTYTIEDFKNLRSRSAIDTRTYTIEDLNGFRGRSHSSLSTKNLSVSPTNIYKTSVGLALKRKTANIKSSRTRQNLQHKWVP